MCAQYAATYAAGAVAEVEADIAEAEEATEESGCRSGCSGSFCRSCNENTVGDKYPNSVNPGFSFLCNTRT